MGIDVILSLCPDRDEAKVRAIEAYLKAVKMLRDYCDPKEDPEFTQVVHLDLNTVVSCVSGPKRPHDRVQVTDMKDDFLSSLTNKVSSKVFIRRKGKHILSTTPHPIINIKSGNVLITGC